MLYSFNVLSVNEDKNVVDVEPDSAYTKWAVGATKADPRGELEQMSGGRAWIKCAHVDGIFDQRWWLSQYFSYLIELPCRLTPHPDLSFSG